METLITCVYVLVIVYIAISLYRMRVQRLLVDKMLDWPKDATCEHMDECLKRWASMPSFSDRVYNPKYFLLWTTTHWEQWEARQHERRTVST